MSVVGDVDISPNVTKNVIPEDVKSPGMKYTHYSPVGDLVIVKGTPEQRLEKIIRQIRIQKGKTIGILTTDETRENFRTGVIISLGSVNDPEEMSRNLFDRLRVFDSLSTQLIFAEDIPVTNETLALVNRLYKAAGYNFI